MATYDKEQPTPPEGWEVADGGILTIPATTTPTLPKHTHGFPVVTDSNVAQGTVYYSNSTHQFIPPNQQYSSSSGISYTWPTTPVAPQYTPPFSPAQYEQPIVPLFADAVTCKAALQRQLLVLESLQEDGHVGPLAEALADAIFFLNETMEALEKISGA